MVAERKHKLPTHFLSLSIQLHARAMSISNRTRSNTIDSDSADLEPRYLHGLILQLQGSMQELQQDNIKIRQQARHLQLDNDKIRQEMQEQQTKHEKEMQDVWKEIGSISGLVNDTDSVKRTLAETTDCVRRNAESIAKLAKGVKDIEPLFDNVQDGCVKAHQKLNAHDRELNNLRQLQVSHQHKISDIKDCEYNFTVCRHTQVEVANLKESMHKFNGLGAELLELKATIEETKTFMEAGFTAAKGCNLKRKDDADNLRRRITYLEGGKPVKREKAASTTTTTPEELRPAPVEAPVHTLYDTNGAAALQVAQLPTEPGVRVTIPLISL